MPSFLKISLALLPLMAAELNATISEPPNTYYGEVVVDSQVLTANSVQYSVLVKFNGVELDRYTMGNLEQAADNYVLRVPTDAIGNRLENTTREGDSVEFYLADAFGEENLLLSYNVGQRGQSHYLQLQWQDSDGDGVNDFIGGSAENTVSNSVLATQSLSSDGSVLSGQQSTASDTENNSLNRLTNEADSEANASSSLLLSAWVGEANSQVNLPAAVAGAALYRSIDADCNLVNYSLCDFGQMDIVNDDTLVDTAAQLNQAAYYTLLATKGAQYSGGTLIVDVEKFSPVLPEGGRSLTSYKNKLWLVGGGLDLAENSLWSSEDGLNWQEHNVQGELSLARIGHQVVSFKDQLWLIGGETAQGFIGDIWSSNDGITWQKRSASAGFSPRANHQLLSLNDQLWLIGGKNASGELSDAWVSDDGLNWQASSLPAEFAGDVELNALDWPEKNSLSLIGQSLIESVDVLQSTALNDFLYIVSKDKPQEIWRLDRQGELRKGFVGEFFYAN